MKNDYILRIADKVLKERLEAKGAVLIEGPKWCGKTTTAKQIAETVIEMDRPKLMDQYKEMAKVDPSALLIGEPPLLIDEWQLAPNLWNAVRYEVDQRDEFGQFILTGSAVPAHLDEGTHTGTGRIARMRMRPMSLIESQDGSGGVSIAELFESKKVSGESSIEIEKLAYYICRGGWPKAIGKGDKVALRQAVDYYDAVVHYDVSRVDGTERNPARVKSLLRSYARHIGTSVSLETIRTDIKEEESETFSEETLYKYINALKGIFLIDDVLAWNPNLRSKTAIRTAATRYFVDPSIAAAACGIGPDDLVGDLKTMGFFFENLCIRDLKVYADLLDGEIYHYRDKTGLECDAVIHLRNGKYGLIEIKLGGSEAIEEGAKNLLKLANKIDTDKMKPPSFRMVIIGVGQFAYQREDGVYVVPIGCLEP